MFSPTPLMSYFKRGAKSAGSTNRENGSRASSGCLARWRTPQREIWGVGDVSLAKLRPRDAVEPVVSARGEEVVIHHLPHLINDLQIRRRRRFGVRGVGGGSVGGGISNLGQLGASVVVRVRRGDTAV